MTSAPYTLTHWTTVSSSGERHTYRAWCNKWPCDVFVTEVADREFYVTTDSRLIHAKQFDGTFGPYKTADDAKAAAEMLLVIDDAFADARDDWNWGIRCGAKH